MENTGTTLRWGVIGTGNIANTVTRAIKQTDGAILQAVVSRSQAKADDFAAKWGFAHAYGNYDDFFDDDTIDAVYIATPHDSHAELSVRAMESGKHVMCEKPAAVNAEQIKVVLETAKRTNRFFMEAVWTRFQPAFNKALELVAQGEIGKVRAFYADFCIDCPQIPGSRLYEPSLAGGALLDVGIYPLMASLSFAKASLNRLDATFRSVAPEAVQSLCRKTETGVDGYDTIALQFPGGMNATITAAINCECGTHFKSARIAGTNGVIHLPEFWYGQQVNIINKDGTLRQQLNFPFEVNGYEYEFAEFHRYIAQGLSESPVHPHDDTLFLIEQMDSLRKTWGIVYPFEKPQDTCTAKTASAAADSTNVPDTDQKKKTAPEVVIYTDGACSGNPGKGGWGAVIIAGTKECRISGGEKFTTNNRMELMATIQALKRVAAEPSLAGAQITMITDSQYVKNGIQDWIKKWKSNGWLTGSKEPVKNKDLWKELDEAVSHMNIEWRWVKGHAGNRYNEICDTLATTAAKGQ